MNIVRLTTAKNDKILYAYGQQNISLEDIIIISVQKIKGTGEYMIR